MLTKLSVTFALVLFTLGASAASAGDVKLADVRDKSFRVSYKTSRADYAARAKQWKINQEQAGDARPARMLALRAPIEITNPVSAMPDGSSFGQATMPRQPASQPRKAKHKHARKAHGKHAKRHHAKTK